MKKSLGKPIATRKKSRTKIHKNWFFTLPLFALGQKISEANYLVLISPQKMNEVFAKLFYRLFFLILIPQFFTQIYMIFFVS